MLFVSLKVKKTINGKIKASHTKEKLITVFYAKQKKASKVVQSTYLFLVLRRTDTKLRKTVIIFSFVCEAFIFYISSFA